MQNFLLLLSAGGSALNSWNSVSWNEISSTAIFTRPILPSYPGLTPVAVLDIVVFAFLLYQFFMAVRGRRAARIFIGLVSILAIYGVVTLLGLELMRATLSTLAPYTPFALIVLFQSEIRRALARIGGVRWISVESRLQRREYLEELVIGVVNLQHKKTGALIVVERDVGLRSFIESGIRLDAWLSGDLIEAIFQHGSALHDGAVIVQGSKIAAAACFLPLTLRATARDLGTRHRAAIGITEEGDCLSIIVSEETGSLSVAAFGEMERNISEERLRQVLQEHILQGKTPPQGRDVKYRDEQFEREAARDARAD